MRVLSYGLITVAALALRAMAFAEDRLADRADAPPAAAAANSQPIVDPILLLLRDESVRRELQLSDRERRAIDELLKSNNRLLLAIRDVSPNGVQGTLQPSVKELRRDLAKVMSENQRERLTNLVLQAQGYSALQRKDVAAKLKLSDTQVSELAAAASEFATRSLEARNARAGSTPEQLQEGLNSLQRDRQKRVLAILSKQQLAQYAAALGEPFEFSKVQGSPADAPEFEGIEAWLNSEPISMKSLGGRVVVVHFFAFGCVNCIHNYPWYKEWQTRFSGKDVTIIGIHTPETKREADNSLLEESLKKHGLEFPVAIDKQRKMWDAWSNGIWPSVYIIDKQGRLRYWWYGELDWRGAGNQKVAQRQIEQLVAEE